MSERSPLPAPMVALAAALVLAVVSALLPRDPDALAPGDATTGMVASADVPARRTGPPGPASAPALRPPELDEEDEGARIGTEPAGLGWWKVNTHGHARAAGAFTARDDGLLPVAYWIERYAVKGFDLVFFTPHSHKNLGAAGKARWLSTRAALPKVKAGMGLALGAEIGVPRGPEWRRFASADFVGNVHHHLNHIVVLGASEFISAGATAREVVDRAHASGGVAILAHPEIWEPGYWDGPDASLGLDGLEVYNALLMSVTDRDNAPLYRRATSYGGLGMKVAAIGGSDTHKKKAVAGAATWFAGTAPSPTDFVDAVRRRATFATSEFDDLHVECPGMGETRHGANVELSIRLDRVVDAIVLWKEQRVAYSWANVASADWLEPITEAGAYSWEVRDGNARGYSSAIWYEPMRARAPPSRSEGDMTRPDGRRPPGASTPYPDPA